MAKAKASSNSVSARSSLGSRSLFASVSLRQCNKHFIERLEPSTWIFFQASLNNRK